MKRTSLHVLSILLGYSTIKINSKTNLGFQQLGQQPYGQAEK
jgi:hypothetical protein